MVINFLEITGVYLRVSQSLIKSFFALLLHKFPKVDLITLWVSGYTIMD